MKDITKMSDAELQAEIKKRQKEKRSERDHYRQLVCDAVPEIVELLRRCSLTLSEVKTQVFADLKALTDLKVELYQVTKKNRSHTFTDDNGNTVTLGFRVMDGWDDTVTEGVEKVREFIASLAKDEETAKLVSAINQLLKKDAKGNLKASRVLELEKLANDFSDDDFTDAVGIIRDAYKPVRSCFFIEASFTNKNGDKVGVPLSISSVPFLKENENINKTN